MKDKPCGEMLRLARTNFALIAVLVAAGAGALFAARPQAPSSSATDRPCVERRFEGAVFTICRFDSSRMEFRLASRDAHGAIMRNFHALSAELGPENERVRFAMNAGMFDADGAPIGLYVEQGDIGHPLSLTEGPGNFHMQPNGVFSVAANRTVRIETSEAFAVRDAEPLWATQSGPMLVVSGALHPSFRANGASRLVRNGVGVRDARTAYFVISVSPVSFGSFARLFRDRLGCRDALYLDGVVSSLWAPRLRRMDARVSIGPMLVVLDG